jgi:hypothetical protein
MSQNKGPFVMKGGRSIDNDKMENEMKTSVTIL